MTTTHNVTEKTIYQATSQTVHLYFISSKLSFSDDANDTYAFIKNILF